MNTKVSKDKHYSKDHPPNRIAELRNEAELTQEQLADQVGVSEGTIGNWENNGKGSDIFYRAYLLTDVLECSLIDLLREGSTSKFREEKDISVRGLAGLVEVGPSTISNWENKPDGLGWIKKVARVCAVLDCSSPEDLFDHEDLIAHQESRREALPVKKTILEGEELIKALERAAEKKKKVNGKINNPSPNPSFQPT